MSQYHHGLSDEVMLDRLVLRHADRDTYGAAATHGLDPAEIVARMEECRLHPAARIQHEREALRTEVLAGFIEYCFCDGPDPAAVGKRMHGFIASFSVETLILIHGDLRWITRAKVRAVLRKPAYRAKLLEIARSRREGNLSAWWRELQTELDAECVCATIAAIIEYIISQGHTWRNIVAVAFALAKAFHPHLIAGMSLEDIATLCGDAGRATPSDRIKRLVNRRMEANGGRAASVHFQKSESTVRKYQLAQMGNTNRAKKQPQRKRP